MGGQHNIRTGTKVYGGASHQGDELDLLGIMAPPFPLSGEFVHGARGMSVFVCAK